MPVTDRSSPPVRMALEASADAPGLDPTDWSSFTSVAHRAVDDMAAYLSHVGERAVWRPIPPDIRSTFESAVPRHGIGDAATYDVFARTVLPFPAGNLHPRFWGWVMGTGVPSAMIAEFVASGMNPNCGGLEHSAGLVEAQVLRWMSELLLDSNEASGVLVSSASVANLVALTTALHARAGFDVRHEGLVNAPHRLACYGSMETHSWIKRACSVLGLGESAFRAIPSDDAFQVDVRALTDAIARDRAQGVHPFCVIGTAGTVNTGATDDLQALADLCANEGIWFHVDGAFGALARLSPALAPLVAGIERADSLAFDLHKWGYLPYGIAAVLVRDPAAHLGPFTTTPSYLQTTPRGPMTTGITYGDKGLDLSRDFMALKAWFTFTSHGVNAIAHNIEGNVAQAQYLAKRVHASPLLELMAPVPLNLVTFRFAPPVVEPGALDALNAELLMRMQERGIAVPSATRVRERYAIRVAITNHRTRLADMDVLVDAVEQIGNEILNG